MIQIQQLVIPVAQGIYVWYQKGNTPERLTGNILALFQRFKGAYDAKNAEELSRVISDSYSGSLYLMKNKDDLVQLFRGVFNSIPVIINPNLTINVYQILEDSAEGFRAIINFKSNLNLLFVPLKSVDTGRVHIEIRPEKPFGVYKIKSIDVVEE